MLLTYDQALSFGAKVGRNAIAWSLVTHINISSDNGFQEGWGSSGYWISCSKISCRSRLVSVILWKLVRYNFIKKYITVDSKVIVAWMSHLHYLDFYDIHFGEQTILCKVLKSGLNGNCPSWNIVFLWWWPGVCFRLALLRWNWKKLLPKVIEAKKYKVTRKITNRKVNLLQKWQVWFCDLSINQISWSVIHFNHASVSLCL